jgi:hypothetical protein
MYSLGKGKGRELGDHEGKDSFQRIILRSEGPRTSVAKWS